MGALKIIKPGLMTTLQDRGRHGYAYYAIATSGVMDTYSAELANLIVGNDNNYPVIEFTNIPPVIEFITDGIMALTGAECSYLLNNIPIKINSPHRIKKGDILKGRPFSKGLRGYLAVSGQIKRNKYLNSMSYHSYPHNDIIKHSLLKKNDIVEWQSETKEISDLSINIKSTKDNIVKIKPGPEYGYLSQSNKEQLIFQVFKITPDSNRMGLRLSSLPIICNKINLDYSVAVFPGIIQLTSSGQLIIILQDGQTTGGYPRIAYISIKELSRLNQIRISKEIRFSI